MQPSEIAGSFILYSRLQRQNVLSASALDVGIPDRMSSSTDGTEDSRQGLLETEPSEHVAGGSSV